MTNATSASAAALLDESLVWDHHTCMPLRPHDLSFLPQLQRHKAAGFDAVTVNIGFGGRASRSICACWRQCGTGCSHARTNTR